MAVRADLLQYIRCSVLGDEQAGISSGERYPVQVRDVPSQTYLYRTHHLHGPELPVFIAESTAYLVNRADHYGGARGLVSVMFHGQVDLDSDGPVDVCLPVAFESAAEGGDLVRTESAHMQVYTVLREHQMVFPQILQVYQWMRRWIDSRGYEISGLPREIHLTDFATARPDDLICEVAYPVHVTKGPTR